MPLLSSHFFLRVGTSNDEFHLWDIHGYVASTADPQQLADWILLQQCSNSYFGLRAHLDPTFVAARQEVLGALGTGHVHLGHSRFKKTSSVKLDVKDGDDLLSKLGL